MLKKIEVNPEYRALVPRHSPEEYKALEADMLEKGEATEPLIVNEKGVLLDGHTRWEIIDKHPEIKYRTETRSFDTDLDEKLFVISVNLKRRHLTAMQKIMLAKPIEDLIAEKARQQQGTRTDLTSCSNEQKVIKVEGADERLDQAKKRIEHDIELQKRRQRPASIKPIDTASQVAKVIGVSRATYVRGKKIRDEAPPEILKEALSKSRMINYSYNKLKKKENLAEAHAKGTPEMPEGQYDIIYADPPWRYDSEASQRGKADNHYATMTTQDICDLQVQSADNALLFMWATNAHLPDAFKVLKAWGFDYVTNAVWIKDKIGLGWFFRGQHELLLLARKGKMPHPEDHNRFSTVIMAPRGEHSAKPEVVYEMIETMYPNRRFLEMFSRNQREGWTMWGLEAN